MTDLDNLGVWFCENDEILIFYDFSPVALRLKKLTGLVCSVDILTKAIDLPLFWSFGLVV